MGSGYCWHMKKRVEIEIDDELVQEAIRRFHLADAREAVHLALRTLLGEAGTEDAQGDEYDEFSDLSAWQPQRGGNGG
jgi:Arc/MetJ family transcription regulator